MISHEGHQWGGHSHPDSPLYLETRYFRSFWAIWPQSAQKIEKMLQALTLNVAVSSMPCAENIYWSKNDLKLPFLQQVALLPLSTHGGVSDSWSSQSWRRRSFLWVGRFHLLLTWICICRFWKISQTMNHNKWFYFSRWKSWIKKFTVLLNWHHLASLGSFFHWRCLLT